MLDRPDNEYDVVIMGGAFSGAATAILLLRRNPKLRVLILEKSARFGRRVGESTVEVSSYFLGRVLGLTQYLNDEHLVKQGLRFWFYNGEVCRLDQCSEIGGRYLARIPGYQVDRAKLDEEILRRAVQAGAKLWRPATVQKAKLAAGAMQQVTVRYDDQQRQLRARWVVDASGVAALIARQEGWWRPNSAHPTTAVWARWSGVKDWDSPELIEKFPEWGRECYGTRGTATNHFVGDGWWAWCIPLKGGDVSVGVVFDQRLVQWPDEGPLGQRLKDFLCRHPAAKEIISEARWHEGDVHWRKNLPYYSTTYAGDGFVLVGDAAAFLDPFYSPGMDWIAYTASCAAELIASHLGGEHINGQICELNRALSQSYTRWFEAVYQDKYEYMGDYELMRLAFLFDLGLYYAGVVSQPFHFGAKAYLTPVFSDSRSTSAYLFMRWFNSRFAQIARLRRARGDHGRANHDRRFMFGGYTLDRPSLIPVLKAMVGWGRLEIAEAGRRMFRG